MFIYNLIKKKIKIFYERLFSTNHKDIGRIYLILVFLVFGILFSFYLLSIPVLAEGLDTSSSSLNFAWKYK